MLLERQILGKNAGEDLIIKKKQPKPNKLITISLKLGERERAKRNLAKLPVNQLLQFSKANFFWGNRWQT